MSLSLFDPLDIATYQDFSPERLAELGFTLQHDLSSLSDWYLVDGVPAGLLRQAKLDELELGVYQSAVGVLLLGSTDESLHPHDRWYSLSTRQESWHSIQAHQAFRLRRTMNQVSMLNAQRTAYQRDIISSGDATNPWTPSLFWRARPYGTRTALTLKGALLSDLLTPTDLHDLTFHYDTWVVRNPEFTGMPEEIVWRMHGVGKAYERARSNRVRPVAMSPDIEAFEEVGA